MVTVAAEVTAQVEMDNVELTRWKQTRRDSAKELLLAASAAKDGVAQRESSKYDMNDVKARIQELQAGRKGHMKTQAEQTSTHKSNSEQSNMRGIRRKRGWGRRQGFSHPHGCHWWHPMVDCCELSSVPRAVCFVPV